MAVSRDHYYRLASDIEAERISAAVALINELTDAQQESEWEYALERLIKGLSSSRGSARLGFSMCLSELATIRIAADKLTFPQLIDLINKHTKIAASMNGKEERAMLFGKLFGLQAVSGLVVNSGEDVDGFNFKLFIDNLIELSCLKSWIREPSLFTIFNILQQNGAKLSKGLVIYIFSKIDEDKLSLSIEGLALYLSISPELRSEMKHDVNFQNATWSECDPLHKSNLNLVSKVLKDVAIGDETNTTENGKEALKKKGNWSPRLHFVWGVLINELLKNDEDEDSHTLVEAKENSKKRSKSDSKKSKKSKKSSSSLPESIEDSDKITVKEFWKIIIDEGFFSEKASHERKYWGFEIFELVLPKVPYSKTSILFTNNFMRTLINQSADSQRFLFKVAKRTLSSIVEVTKEQPHKIKPILSELLIGEYGNLQFDQLTKSKTVESILKTSNESTNYEVAEFFVKILDSDLKDKDSEDLEKRSKWVIDQLLHFVRFNKNSLSLNSDLKWIDLILKSLVLKAYFKPVDQANDGSEIAEFAQERLNSILSDVISIPRTDNQTWSYKTLTLLLAESEDTSSKLKPAFEFDEEISKTLNKTFKILKKIRALRESSTHLDNSKLLIFELLNSMVLLQLYTGDFSESIEILTELQDYYYNSIKGNNSENEDDVIGIVEILMNFLSQKSSLLKKLSFIVWENFCDKIDLNCLELLFNVLTTRENKEGQKALFEGEDEFVEDDEEDGEEDGKLDSNEDKEEQEEEEEEEEDEEEESTSKNESDSEDSDSDSDSDEEGKDKDVDEVEKKTNVALAEALKIPHNGEVILSSDEDSDFSDESMDDEQMMEIDDQLSQIFKQRQDALNNVKSKSGNVRKLEKENAKSSIILFKTRVVDLLEIYIKKNPTSELIVFMVLPLLKGLKLTLDKSLGVKIHKLLKNKICKSKVDKVTIAQKQELFEILEKILNKDFMLRNSNSNDFNSSCSQCSIFIIKKFLELDGNGIDQVIDLYTDLLKSWFKKKNSKLPSSTFFNFINWLESKRSSNAS